MGLRQRGGTRPRYASERTAKGAWSREAWCRCDVGRDDRTRCPPLTRRPKSGICPATGCDPDTERPTEPGSASDTARCPVRGRPWAYQEPCGRLSYWAAAPLRPTPPGLGGRDPATRGHVRLGWPHRPTWLLLSAAHAAHSAAGWARSRQVGKIHPGFHQVTVPAFVKRAHFKTGGHGGPHTAAQQSHRVPYVGGHRLTRAWRNWQTRQV